MAPSKSKYKRGRGRPRKFAYKARTQVGRYSKAQNYTLRITRFSNLDNANNCHITLSGSAAGNNIGSSTFKLSDCPNNNELTALFDNYCIRKVLYRWVLLRDPSAFQTTAGTQGIFPRITWVHDFNDSNPLARNQLMQYPKMKEFFFSETKQKTKWFSLRPASLSLLYETGVQTAYKPTWGSYVDTLDSNMVHYGLKYAHNNLFEGNTLILEAKYVMDFKGIS